MAFIETTDGVRLFYKDWGTGHPIVLVHGWCINCDSWEYVMTNLVARGFRCVAFDLRGCGRSDQPWNGYDYDTLAADLASLIEALNLRDVTLAGHSMAGGLIMRYLARHGDSRTARAVLIGTTTPFTLKTPDNPDGIDLAYFDAMITQMTEDRPRYVASLAPAFFGSDANGNTVSPEMVQWGIGLTLQASPQAAVGLLRANTEADQRDELTQITVPTLLIHGDQDASCPLDLTARRTQELLSNSRLTVYRGKAHGIYITEAKRITDDITTFIDESTPVK
jgi:pimeloyl-ACP methyl ester carboxylesterase